MLTLPWVSSGIPDRDVIEAWRTRGRSTLVTPPNVEPVSIAFAKAHSRIDGPDDDLGIELRLKAARQWVERYIGRALMAQTWEWTLLDGEITHAGPVLLPVGPVISVTSVTSYNAAGSGTVMSSALYFLDKTSVPARVLLTEGSAWPSGLRTFNSLVVRYLSGYGVDGTKADDVPVAIRQAILLVASEFNERREAASDQTLAEVPYGVCALLDPYRVAA